jgi:hypothetical protein
MILMSHRSVKMFVWLLVLLVFGLGAGCSKRATGEPYSVIDQLRDRSAKGPLENDRPPRPISAKDVNAAEPAIAADAAGNVLLAYVKHQSGDASDVVVQRLDAGGAATGAPVRVNPVAGSVKTWTGDPPTIAIGPSGAVYVGWTRRLDDPAGNDLVVSVSRDGGLSFAEHVRVNDDTKPASHGMHSLAIDRRERVYVAWLDERDIKRIDHATNSGGSGSAHEAAEPNSEVFYAVSGDMGKSFSANKKIASGVCPCCKTTLLVAENNVYIAWRQVLDGDKRHIAVARSADDGGTFSEKVIVSDDNWQINACPVSGAAMSSSAEGLLDVVWYTAGTAGPPGLYFAHSGDGGKTFGSRSMVAANASAGTPVLLRGGDRLIALVAGTNDEVIAARWPAAAVDQLASETVNEAKFPAAVASQGKLYVAFVRNGVETGGVWLMIGDQ